MLKVGDKVRIINRSPVVAGGHDFHSFNTWEIVTVTELLPEYPGAIDCENDKGKRQWLLPQHYELLVETDHE